MQRRTVLVTERLRVTTWLPDDVADLHRLHSDPETMRWIRHGHPETHDEVQTLLDVYLTEQRTRGWTKWRVTDVKGVLVGRAGFGAYHRGPSARQAWDDGEPVLAFAQESSQWEDTGGTLDRVAGGLAIAGSVTGHAGLFDSAETGGC